MTKIVSQRQIYLDNLKAKARQFWTQVVDDYNRGISPSDIAKSYTNPKTGRHYSRQHIHAIIKKIREE